MDPVLHIQQGLEKAMITAAEEARGAGELDFQELPAFVVEVPREKNHGDFATNLGMLLAKDAHKPPRQVGEILLKHLKEGEAWIVKAELAGPGFLNFTLDHHWLYRVLDMVLAAGEAWGRSRSGQGEELQVEFVSANPTGLLHMGNARGAALGDTYARLLEAIGYKVTREFYINDSGNQIVNFGLSLEARYLQLLGVDVPFPDEGYHGEDLIETVRCFTAREGQRYLESGSEERREALVGFALQEKLDRIRSVLERFRVHYDVWFSEQSLHASGEVREVVQELREKGFVYEREGALWFKSTAFGFPKDDVVVRQNGVPTYFAADIAYHKNKFQRGFRRVIDLWGADHHGHVARLKGAMQALEYDPNCLQVVLMQLVRLFQGGETLRMSKRTGQYVTLEELLEEVGVDAARYFFVMRSADSHLDFDLDLARSESQDNPVYYVQYAHARICSMLRQAGQVGVCVLRSGEARLELLQHPDELELLRKLADFPGTVAGAARSLEPHRLCRYAGELAALFHGFYTTCRVLGQELELTEARLALVEATRLTLKNLLGLLGVEAPERM